MYVHVHIHVLTFPLIGSLGSLLELYWWANEIRSLTTTFCCSLMSGAATENNEHLPNCTVERVNPYLYKFESLMWYVAKHKFTQP